MLCHCLRKWKPQGRGELECLKVWKGCQSLPRVYWLKRKDLALDAGLRWDIKTAAPVERGDSIGSCDLAIFIHFPKYSGKCDAVTLF